MLVCDIEENMPPDEFIYWVAYFDLKNMKIKEEANKAKQANRGVKSKRYT